MSAQVEHVGHEPVSSRELFLLEAEDSESVARSVLPARFVCLLAWNAELASVDEISLLARQLLSAGCCYICCWGPRCELVHDVFDETHVGHGEPKPLVMSTWHSEDSLPDALWFALFSSTPDEAFEPCGSVVAISIANSSWAATMRQAMRNPGAFSSDVCRSD
jgi:hypothetical protein